MYFISFTDNHRQNKLGVIAASISPDYLIGFVKEYNKDINCKELELGLRRVSIFSSDYESELITCCYNWAMDNDFIFQFEKVEFGETFNVKF